MECPSLGRGKAWGWQSLLSLRHAGPEDPKGRACKAALGYLVPLELHQVVAYPMLSENWSPFTYWESKEFWQEFSQSLHDWPHTKRKYHQQPLQGQEWSEERIGSSAGPEVPGLRVFGLSWDLTMAYEQNPLGENGMCRPEIYENEVSHNWSGNVLEPLFCCSWSGNKLIVVCVASEL